MTKSNLKKLTELFDFMSSPTEAEQVGALIAGRGELEFMGENVAYSVRLPFYLSNFIDVACDNTSTSKNDVVMQLILAGVEAGWKHMTEQEKVDFSDSFFKKVEERKNVCS
ncbi:Uncharacterised protein [Neisseria lactamica]|nr:Uncharacterised protein [Neisseria lactamica]